MSTPFEVLGSLSLPGTPGSPAEPCPFGLVDQFGSKAIFDLELPDATGTKTVSFGTLPAAGAKMLLLTFVGAPMIDGSTPPPIALTINGGTEPLEISSGGFLCFASPTPVDGLASITIGYTAAGTVKVWLLG